MNGSQWQLLLVLWRRCSELLPALLALSVALVQRRYENNDHDSAGNRGGGGVQEIIYS